jgi:predicted  nucleic acid-binding Zn-ribbon protein
MKYKCTKCDNVFDTSFDAKCPKCGAMDWDVEPVYNFNTVK